MKRSGVATVKKCPTCGKLQWPKAPKKALPEPTAKVRKAAKRVAHRVATSMIREAVEKRADGACENCEIKSFWPLELDHILGGSGQRRAKQSVQTTWLLCRICHRERTENKPSADHWKWAVRLHLERHGYPIPARFR